VTPTTTAKRGEDAEGFDELGEIYTRNQTAAHEASAKAEGAMLLPSLNFLQQVSPSSLLAAVPDETGLISARPPESHLPVCSASTAISCS